MPLHIVKKTVPYIDEAGVLITPDAPNAYKYETLALDLIHEMDDCLVFEIDRNKEFAPVKNRTGIDSVDTARELLRLNGYEL
jgi:UDP-N-acetylglucosamine/UDP-N-acetylgalactosamine diphosphorylase